MRPPNHKAIPAIRRAPSRQLLTYLDNDGCEGMSYRLRLHDLYRATGHQDWKHLKEALADYGPDFRLAAIAAPTDPDDLTMTTLNADDHPPGDAWCLICEVSDRNEG